jgi:hypothetical protein
VEAERLAPCDPDRFCAIQMLPAAHWLGVFWIKALYSNCFFADPEGCSLPRGERAIRGTAADSIPSPLVEGESLMLKLLIRCKISTLAYYTRSSGSSDSIWVARDPLWDCITAGGKGR